MTPGSALYPAVDTSLKRFAASSGKEPGDPRKQAKRIIEVVQREGDLPSRFALGVSHAVTVSDFVCSWAFSRHKLSR